MALGEGGIRGRANGEEIDRGWQQVLLARGLVKVEGSGGGVR